MERCGGGGGGREGAGEGVGCGPGAQRGRWSVKSGGEDENIALKPHIPLGGIKLDSVRGGGGWRGWRGRKRFRRTYCLRVELVGVWGGAAAPRC